MKTELLYLACVATFTALLWVPYVLNRFVAWGIPDTVGYPDQPKPVAPWADRLKKAHANAVENLVVFAPLVLVANALGITGGTLATAAMVYFWSRVVHALAYTFKVPWVRTLGFTGGFLAQMCVAWLILAR
ncbi:MAG: MAPEG family protein [Usitatibacter sp.]